MSGLNRLVLALIFIRTMSLDRVSSSEEADGSVSRRRFLQVALAFGGALLPACREKRQQDEPRYLDLSEEELDSAIAELDSARQNLERERGVGLNAWRHFNVGKFAEKCAKGDFSAGRVDFDDTELLPPEIIRFLQTNFEGRKMRGNSTAESNPYAKDSEFVLTTLEGRAVLEIVLAQPIDDKLYGQSLVSVTLSTAGDSAMFVGDIGWILSDDRDGYARVLQFTIPGEDYRYRYFMKLDQFSRATLSETHTSPSESVELSFFAGDGVALVRLNLGTMVFTAKREDLPRLGEFPGRLGLRVKDLGLIE